MKGGDGWLSRNAMHMACIHFNFIVLYSVISPSEGIAASNHRRGQQEE